MSVPAFQDNQLLKDPYVMLDHNQGHLMLHQHSPMVSLDHVTTSWSHDHNKLVLKDINLEVTTTVPLLAVVGPVGSGKV